MNTLRKGFDKRIKVLGKIEKEVKEELFRKFVSCYDAGFNCFYCGNKMELKWGSELSVTFDHTIPRKAGGKNTAENIELVCRTCNFLKGSKNAGWFADNVKKLKVRKNKRESYKARKSSIRDEAVREAYKDIFLRRGSKQK